MNRTPLKRKTPLRRVSKKRQSENRQYLKQRKAFLEAHPYCEACLEEGEARQATDIHHRNKRNGARLLDEEYWMSVCRKHHDWIHAHPAEARKLGWLV